MEGVAVPYTSLLPGVSSAPVVLAWAILWSLSETIWPAKLAKNKPEKTGSRQDCIYPGAASGKATQEHLGASTNLVPVQSCSERCLYGFVSLSPSDAPLFAWRWFFYFVVAKHLSS